MTFHASMNDPFYEYEHDLEPAGESRMKKIMQLKQAIQAGQYDVDEQLDRLINNLKDKLTKDDDDADYDEDDSESS